MIRLAVVGDIGSGKSHIAKQFGYPVFNADAEVVKLYRKKEVNLVKSDFKGGLPIIFPSFTNLLGQTN